MYKNETREKIGVFAAIAVVYCQVTLCYKAQTNSRFNDKTKEMCNEQLLQNSFSMAQCINIGIKPKYTQTIRNDFG